nr:PREDICTED: rac GTPase-activating protein 1-like [Opisthocomus hoazin]
MGMWSSAVDESCQSLLSHSDISYDRTEDDVDVDLTVVRTLKRKAQERQRVSLAPQIGPVVVAKRHRSSVVPHNTVNVPPVPPPAQVPGPAGSLLPTALVPRRSSRQGHRASTRAADFAPPTPPLVPALVVQCVNVVETRGLTETGLYRVPGAEQLVREWKRRLLRAGGALPALGSVADIHVVCGVLKDFLQRAAPPLTQLPGAVTDIPDDAACGTALRHVVSKLPPANRDTLAFLMLHLLRVSRSPDCKMDVLNLSRVFGPTLVGHGSANPTPLAIMEDTPRQCKVVARLLSLPPDFWRGFVGTEQENLVPTPAPEGAHDRAGAREDAQQATQATPMLVQRRLLAHRRGRGLLPSP